MELLLPECPEIQLLYPAMVSHLEDWKGRLQKGRHQVSDGYGRSLVGVMKALKSHGLEKITCRTLDYPDVLGKEGYYYGIPLPYNEDNTSTVELVCYLDGYGGIARYVSNGPNYAFIVNRETGDEVLVYERSGEKGIRRVTFAYGPEVLSVLSPGSAQIFEGKFNPFRPTTPVKVRETMQCYDGEFFVSTQVELSYRVFEPTTLDRSAGRMYDENWQFTEGGEKNGGKLSHIIGTHSIVSYTGDSWAPVSSLDI